MFLIKFLSRVVIFNLINEYMHLTGCSRSLQRPAGWQGDPGLSQEVRDSHRANPARES